MSERFEQKPKNHILGGLGVEKPLKLLKLWYHLAFKPKIQKCKKQKNHKYAKTRALHTLLEKNSKLKQILEKT